MKFRRGSFVSSESASDRANLIHLVPIAFIARGGCYRGKVVESTVETAAEGDSFAERTVPHVVETMTRASRLYRYEELQL